MFPRRRPKRDSALGVGSPYLGGPPKLTRRNWLTAEAAPRGGSPPIDLGSLGIGLLTSGTDVADAAESLLQRRYSFAAEEDAQILVALGGDGFMLQTLHAMLEAGSTKPVFGMNRGTVGFLMNDWRIDKLP